MKIPKAYIEIFYNTKPYSPYIRKKKMSQSPDIKILIKLASQL